MRIEPSTNQLGDFLGKIEAPKTEPLRPFEILAGKEDPILKQRRQQQLKQQAQQKAKQAKDVAEFNRPKTKTIQTKYGVFKVDVAGAWNPEVYAQIRQEIEDDQEKSNAPVDPKFANLPEIKTEVPVDINTETGRILGETFKALMPAPTRAVSDVVETAGKGISEKGAELLGSQNIYSQLAGLPLTIAGGIVTDVANPLAGFVTRTGNLYDPNATAEERIGAVGNIVGYALGAMNPLEAAGAGIKAFRAGATGTEALTTAGRSLLRSSVPFGTKIDTALANKASLKNLIDVLETEGQMMSKTRAALTKEFVDAGKTFAKETGKTAEEFYTKYLNDFAEGKGQLTTPSPTAPAAFELPSTKAPEGVPGVPASTAIPEPTAPVVEPPTSVIPEPQVAPVPTGQTQNPDIGIYKISADKADEIDLQYGDDLQQAYVNKYPDATDAELTDIQNNDFREWKKQNPNASLESFYEEQIPKLDPYWQPAIHPKVKLPATPDAIRQIQNIVPSEKAISKLEDLPKEAKAIEQWTENNLLGELLPSDPNFDVRKADAVGQHYGIGNFPRDTSFDEWYEDLKNAIETQSQNRVLDELTDTSWLEDARNELYRIIYGFKDKSTSPFGKRWVQNNPQRIIQLRIYDKRANKSLIPTRATKRFVSLADVPEFMREDLLGRVRDDDFVYMTAADYARWKREGASAFGGTIKPKRMSDYANYKGDFYDDAQGLDEAMVPLEVVKEKYAELNAAYKKSKEGDKFAKYTPTKKDLERAFDNYFDVNAPKFPTVEPTPTIEPPTTKPIPPVEPTTVKADIPDVQPTEDLTSFAKRVTGRDPMEGTNAQKIMDGARKFVQDGKINVENLVKNLIDNRTPVNEVESGAILDELAKLKAQQKVIEREAKGSVQDVEEWNRLQGQIERYQQAGDIIGNQFHRLGMALQVAIKEDMSVGSIMRKAKVLNLGDDVSAAMKAKLEDLGQRYEKAVAELEKLKNKGSEIVDAVKRYEGTERFAVKTRERAASVAKNWFEGRDLGGGGFGSRKRGAVTYTIPDDELKARSAVRKLAKEAALDGAETLDAVLDDIRARIGVNVKDEDLLAMIYEPYSKYKIESDLARIKANQALNDVKRAAEFRSKSALGKFSSVFLGTLNGTARAMQVGADFSAPLIQGRKGVFANPIGWLKAYAPMFKAATGKRAQEVALRELAKIEQHPLYGKAKAAGLQLTEPGGTYSRQEENFMTNMDLLLETLEKNKGAKRAVGLPLEGYLNVMVRSEDAFTTYMNALRYDTFVKMAKAAPDDPEYLKDVADIINVIYGRGTGKVAQAAGQIGGELAFAPRYLVSNIQYQSGVPFFKARTAKGKMQAARIYATHAIAMKSLMGLAALAGWKVNTDMRSSKGGSISDGTDTFDLYGKDTQIIRLLTQMAYGKINTKGEYKPPSNMQAATLLGQFGQGKFAPFPRLLSESIFGTFDEEYGGTRPLNKEDYVKKALPLWVGQYLKDADKYGGDAKRQARNTILQLFGEDVSPEPVENPPTPFDITKPGIQQEFAGMADLPPKL